MQYMKCILSQLFLKTVFENLVQKFDNY